MEKAADGSSHKKIRRHHQRLYQNTRPTPQRHPIHQIASTTPSERPSIMDSNEADETKPSAAAAGVEEKTAAAAAPPSGKSKQKGAPNSLPRAKPKPEEASVSTYVYRDFANVRDPVQLGEMLGSELVHEQVPPKKLQNQKLPAKLNAMLSDPGEWLLSYPLSATSSDRVNFTGHFSSILSQPSHNNILCTPFATQRRDLLLHHLDAPRPLLLRCRP